MESGRGSSNKWSIFGSLGAALASAVCCLGPLVLVSLGVTGAWIGNLSALEPYRPLFMVVAAGLLGLGFYRIYGRTSQEEECATGAECEVPKANRLNQVSLWIATVVVVGLFASPYVLSARVGDRPVAQPDSEASASATDDDSAELADRGNTATVTLAVEGMTCGGCATTVESALTNTDGVGEAGVTFEPPQARVTYDPSKVSVEELTKATANVGYPSKPQI